jgi:sarcosine oxidase subunit alpha
MLDGSTLGKIDIQGPDAAAFLNLVYTSAWSKLPVGRCRYGVMCSEDGMVIDDGVTARIAPDRYLMSTNTGTASRVFEHLEDYLQTEWPDLRVWLTSVTDHWAVTVLAGPRARDVLRVVAPDSDLTDATFPHLTVRYAQLTGGIPARLFRISFSGELAYEIHVPASDGLAAWEAIATAGELYGIQPYGTEALHVLRAEKGFIIIGQETDGSVSPLDLGLEWAIAQSKPDYIGKRSLARPEMLRPDRKQLVGLRPLQDNQRIEEGAQLIECNASPLPPVPMIGHVTSSYVSDTLGGPFALALLERGRARHGQDVVAVFGNRQVRCRVSGPTFYDPDGSRLNG